MRSKANRTRTKNAGALCQCGSYDIRFIGRSGIKLDRRPVFKCGSCFKEWTAGSTGMPYIEVAVDGKDTFAEIEHILERREG